MYSGGFNDKPNDAVDRRPALRRLVPLAIRLVAVLTLLVIWAGFPAGSGTAQPLPKEESTAYHSGGIVEFVGRASRPVPASKLAAIMTPGPATQAVGGGQITLTVDDTVDPAYEQYILDLFDTVYPVIVDLYGQPSNNIEVTVHFDDTYSNWFFYNSSADQIIISSYPDIQLPYHPANQNDPAWDGIVTHELVHAFHDTVFLFASWAEEGMTEAAAEIVADYLYDQGIRDIRQRVAQYNILMSDTWDAMGPNTLGGTTYSFYKAIPDLFYRASPAIFWKLTTSQTATSAGDWPHYNFLERLNLALYDYAATNSTFISESAFFSIVEAVATEPIDGQPARAWLEAQSVTAIGGEAGVFLGLYPSRFVLTASDAWVKTPTNPDRIYAFAFERTLGQTAWDTQETLITNGAQVNFVIEDSAGTQVHSGSIVLDRTWAYAGIDTSAWEPGAYTIRAEVTIDGAKITAKNSFIVGPSIVSKEDGLGIVLMDEAGQLISQPVSMSGGTPQLNANGAAVIVPENLSQLPQAPAVGEQLTTAPLPYTRVRSLTLTNMLSEQSLVTDLNRDGQVDATDIQLVADAWRSNDPSVTDGRDLDGDGSVTVNDVMIVTRDWGATATPEQVAEAAGPTQEPEATPEEAPVQVPAGLPERPLVLANYVSHFRAPDVSGEWQGWIWDPDGDGGQDEGDHIPDRLGADGQPDLASAHQPLIGPYDSSAPAVIEYQIASAWAAGIDGFVAQWYGPQDEAGVDEALRLVYDTVSRWREKYGLDFFLANSYDEQALLSVSPEGRAATAAAQLRYLLERYASQPGYLTYNGASLVFYSAGGVDGASGVRRGAALDHIKEALPDAHLVYVGDARQPQDVSKATYSWVTGQFESTEDGGVDWVSGTQGESGQDAGAANWVYPEAEAPSEELPAAARTVWPGFDNSKVWTWGDEPRYVGREDGATYARAWDGALQTVDEGQAPGWVRVVSWNDWNAGTEIEPSVEFGRYYLEETQRHAARFTGRTMPPDALLVPQAILEARRSQPGPETEAIIESVYRLFFAREFDAALAKLRDAGLLAVP